MVKGTNKRFVAPLVIAALVYLLLLTSGLSLYLYLYPPIEAQQTYTPYPTYTRFPTIDYSTATPYPTYTYVPTPEPLVIILTMPPTLTPTIMMQDSGFGLEITERYTMPACENAVFHWKADGWDNFIIHLHKTGTEAFVYLVNEIGPIEGETIQPLTGGEYYFDVRGPEEGWTIRVECQD